MSSKHLGLAADIIPSVVGISPLDKLVLIVLAQRADSDTGESFPSLQYIAWHSGVSRPGVQRSIKALVACGLIRVRPRERGSVGGQTSNLYELDFYRLSELFTAQRDAEMPKRVRYDRKKADDDAAPYRQVGHQGDAAPVIKTMTRRSSQRGPNIQERNIQERNITLSHARGADFEAFSQRIEDQVGDDGDWPALATRSLQELFDLAAIAPDEHLVPECVQFAVLCARQAGGKLKSWKLATEKAREYLAMVGVTLPHVPSH